MNRIGVWVVFSVVLCAACESGGGSSGAGQAAKPAPFKASPSMERLARLAASPATEQAESIDRSGETLDIFNFSVRDVSPEDVALMVNRKEPLAWAMDVNAARISPEDVAPAGSIVVLSRDDGLKRANPSRAKERPDLDVTTRCIRFDQGPFAGKFALHSRSADGGVSRSFIRFQSHLWAAANPAGTCSNAILSNLLPH